MTEKKPYRRLFGAFVAGLAIAGAAFGQIPLTTAPGGSPAGTGTTPSIPSAPSPAMGQGNFSPVTLVGPPPAAAAATAASAPGTAQRPLQGASAAAGDTRGQRDGERRVPPAGSTREDATEFQRFVRDSTGRELPLFGYNLFTSGAFPAAQNVPVPVDYVVGPGDEIELRLWGAVDADLRLVVDRNGQITIPRVGTVNVAGQRASQLQSLLRSQIGRVFNNFQISASLGQLRSIQIFVVGQARQPGAYTVSSLSTMVSALFEVGGPAATGSMRNIQLRRDGRIVSTLDMYRFIGEGDKTADSRLQPGDVIVIPGAGPRVALTGAIDVPAIYELASAEEPLGKVLSYAGRTNVLTTQHKVLIERVDASRAKAPRVVEERALDARGLQNNLRDGDIVTLFKISPEYANAVTLRGNVAAPLRYTWRPGMKISDLIPERDALISPDYYIRRNALVQFESGRRVNDARVQSEVKNLLEEINWDYAVVERLDPNQIRSQLIPFNLAKAVIEKDPANDLALLPGDVVTIFGVNDLPVPVSKRSQYARISGEVNVPGVYQLQPGETLDQLLARVGGFTRNAYPYGTVFTRESTRQQQQKNLDRAIRRMEAEISSQTAAAVQTAAAKDTGNAEGSIQAQLIAQRQLLSRLQTLRASGRIALELDARSSTLPPVVLEDGDEIVVPTMPSFVGVFGAVTAETSFLYRYNFTARDYVERAGPTRDADNDYVAIIRADGTVETDSGFSGGVFNVFKSSVLGRRMNPGDSIFVPEKFDKRSAYARFIEGVKDWTTVLYQFGLGVAGIKVLRD